MKLNQKYGGYLIVSWCGNQYDPNINPIATMKLNPAFARHLQTDAEAPSAGSTPTRLHQSDMERCLRWKLFFGVLRGMGEQRAESTGSDKSP